MASFNNFVKKTPNYLQKFYYDLIPFERRYGSEFLNTYNFLLNSIEWDRNKLLQYQNEQLLKLIKHSYENVPYYTKLFNLHGIKLNNIQSKEDLKLLPLLTKEIIRDNLEDLKL